MSTQRKKIVYLQRYCKTHVTRLASEMQSVSGIFYALGGCDNTAVTNPRFLVVMAKNVTCVDNSSGKVATAFFVPQRYKLHTMKNNRKTAGKTANSVRFNDEPLDSITNQTIGRASR